MRRVEELLNNEGGNYILPFLWLHGEEHDVIKAEIDRIEECGIGEMCLESRPHPEYCGPKWWSDVDFIMEEARKRNMRVWILDDDKFPTGHANGAFIEKYPELAKVYLAERHMDLVGPAKNNAVLIRPFVGKAGKLIKVLAIHKPDPNTTDLDGDHIIDLTENVQDGFVYFDLPEGYYRLLVIFTTMNRGGREDYMNLIDSRSVGVLIDEVYEKHYERYKEDFGKTFAGFFSDEPELGNTTGYSFHDELGKEEVKLPWSEELHEVLTEQWGDDLGYYLPALWFDLGKKTVSIRSQYMDSVTKLVYKCFSGQIGQWCQDHGVEYIGHVIEDDNAHARLGCSVGHYFREQKGQHMSGIDIVHYQIVPGFNDKIHQWLSWNTDGEFFHYGLGKMGSSAAHIDPKKKGRALCEIFGNYGWAEGVSFMKWLVNHMLVRGINQYVPHAFSPKFPDRDCPPHFSAGGNNPQFQYFTLLMKYVNRISHLISDGVHISDAAVLYHGESEWSTGKTQLFQKPVRALMEAQLDCDVIPADIFSEDYVYVENNKLIINEESYGCLILPYSQYIPQSAVDFIERISVEGLNVYVVDGLPEADTCNDKLSKRFLELLQVVKLEELADVIKNNQKTEIECKESNTNLRFYCYKQESEKVYLFFNEDPIHAVDTKVLIKSGVFSSIIEYNAITNKTSKYRINDNVFSLRLEPGQLRIFIPKEEMTSSCKMPECIDSKEIICDWKVSLLETGNDKEFEEKMIIRATEHLPNMNGPRLFSEFSGLIRYEGVFYANKIKGIKNRLYLSEIGDCAEITLNGINVGTILASPDRVDITYVLKDGENHLKIDVANTLVWKLRDGVSAFMQLKPTGMTANPIIEYYK